MKYLSLILLFFVFVFSIDKKYDKIYYESYNNTLKFINKNESLFVNLLGFDELERFEKISIVFPELLRYSMFKDVLETTALELIYVNYGKEQADFSIGYFQMKPSFIESLETKISQETIFYQKFNSLITYRDSSNKEIRKERVERLKSLEWQLKYLDCFYAYISDQYSGYEWRKIEDRIRFFATAYNHDFSANKNEIDKWINQKMFPFGVVKRKKQYAYSDIAFFYYKNALIGNN